MFSPMGAYKGDIEVYIGAKRIYRVTEATFKTTVAGPVREAEGQGGE